MEHDQNAFRFPLLMKAFMALGGILAGFVICRIFITPVTVADNAMEPTLRPGTPVVVLKHITPVRGDVILMDSPAEPGRVLLRRVVALEGDTVEIRDKNLYINNRLVTPAVKTRSTDGRIFPLSFSYRDTMPALKLKRKEYLVLGDNRDLAYDSRTFGIVAENLVIGRVIHIF